MKKICLVLILLSPSMISSAQQTDSLKYKYINLAIFRSGNIFMKGSERLGFRDLAPEFTLSSTGMDLYRQSKKYRTLSTVFRFASLATSLAGLAVASRNNLSDRQRNTAVILLGGQLVLGLTSAQYFGRSQSALDKALFQRNKDLLFPAR